MNCLTATLRKHRTLTFVISFLAVRTFGAANFTQDNTKRKEVLAEMLRVFPKSEPWEAWLQKTGAFATVQLRVVAANSFSRAP